MSVVSTASPVPAHPQDELTVHDRRVTVHGMDTQYLDTQYLDTQYLDTQYLEAGAGPALLLLHGHEQSATSWRWVIPRAYEPVSSCASAGRRDDTPVMW